MKTRILILSILAAVIVAGCNHNSSAPRVKKITNKRGSNEYFYAADNKLNYIQNSNGSKTVYKFNGNTVEQSIVDSATGRSSSSTFYLNAKGLADSIVTKQGPDVYVSSFKHDADGLITGLNQYVGGSLQQITTSQYKDGNKVSTTIGDSANTKLGTIYFEYFLDKDNSINYANQGLGFLGSESKNLQKKIVQVRASGDTLGSVTFVYHFDDKGRVAQEVVYQGPMQLDSTSYTYY